MNRAPLRPAALLAMAFAAPAGQAAPTRPAGIISLSLDHAPDSRLLRVTIRNTTGRAQCLPRNWAAGSRLRATRGNSLLDNREDWEGRPLPGCTALPAGGRLGTVYRLDRMFASLLAGDRLCYTIPWQPGPVRGLASTTRCVVVR